MNQMQIAREAIGIDLLGQLENLRISRMVDVVFIVLAMGFNGDRYDDGLRAD